MRPVFLAFLFACALVFTALFSSNSFAVAAAIPSVSEADRKRFSYLSLLSDGDLSKFLEESQVTTSGDELRADLIALAIAVEKAKEASVVSGGGSIDGTGHRIEVKYCVGWGYKDRFAHMANHILRKLPNVEIVGGNQEPGPVGQFIGSITSPGILYSLAALGIAQFMDQNHPFAQAVNANRTPVFIGGYVLMMIGGQAMSTGAFEVTVDGKKFYSKLESGRMPDVYNLADLIIRRIQQSK